MIKLQDFAKQQGVTDRAIQKHLKTYAEELEGLYQRKGPNGTWLTDEACEILRSKMKQPPAPIIFEEDPRIPKLEARVDELEKLLSEKEKMLTISQQATQEAQNKVNLMLDEVQKVKGLEEGTKALEGKLKDAEDELKAVKERNQELEDRTLGDYLKGLFRKKKE